MSFDIWKKFWCHRSVHLRKQLPEVPVSLDKLYVSYSFCSRPVGTGAAEKISSHLKISGDVFPKFMTIDAFSKNAPTSLRWHPADVLHIFIFLPTWRTNLFRDFRLPRSFRGPPSHPSNFCFAADVLYDNLPYRRVLRDFRLPTTFRRPPDVYTKKVRKKYLPCTQGAPFWANLRKISQNVCLPTSSRNLHQPMSF